MSYKEFECSRCAGKGSHSQWDGNKYAPILCKECNGTGIVIIGCGKKIDYLGDCYYISSRGNLRLCSRCKRLLEKYSSKSSTTKSRKENKND